MRVLICTVVHHPADARIYHRQIRALLEAGHQVTYIAPFGEPGAPVRNAVLAPGGQPPGDPPEWGATHPPYPRARSATGSACGVSARTNVVTPDDGSGTTCNML